MNEANPALPSGVATQGRPYQGGYWIGFLLLGVAVLRAAIFYGGQPPLATALLCMAGYGLLYSTEPLLARRVRRIHIPYFPAQVGLLLALTNLQPFLDSSCLLYLPLWVPALRAFPRRAAMACIGLFAALMSATLMLGMGWAEGMGLALVMLASGAFFASYDALYARTRADQAESEALLAELRQAHRRLEEHAAQAQELAAARERNRLAREMNDSVSQVIFSIRLTAQATRLLLDRDPGRVSQELDRLQEMTGSALLQLRSLIAQLHPPQGA